MNERKLPKCTLTDEELILKAREWVTKLCKTGGMAFTMEVPVNFNSDTDMIFSEIISRFKESLETKKTILRVTAEMNLLLDKLEQNNK